MLSFLKNLLRCLPVLAATYDAERFKRGVDFVGLSRPAQVQAQARQEHIEGLSHFDADKVSVALKHNLMHHYVSLCLALEEIPPRVASFGERCPCHSPVTEHIKSVHFKQQFLAQGFGADVLACPAAGMMAAELVSGALHDFLLDLWRDVRASLYLVMGRRQ